MKKSGGKKTTAKAQPAPQDTARYPTRHWVGIIAAVLRDREVLLVRRGKPPYVDHWGLPGGSLELGEDVLTAAMREVKEETGVVAEPFGVIETIEVIERDAKKKVEYHFILIVVGAHWVKGEGRAATDAAEVRWVSPDDIAGLKTSLPDVAHVVQKAFLQRAI